MKMSKVQQLTGNRYIALILNLVLAFAILMVARIIFIAYNYSNYYEGFLTWDLITGIFSGGTRFDFATLFYLNAIYILLYLFPIGYKESNAWYKGLKWLFIITNGIGLAANLCDCVYVRFTGRRTTATVFAEFANENNLFKIFATEFIGNFLLVALFALMIWAIWKLYRTPNLTTHTLKGWKYYAGNICTLAVVALCAVGAIRGGIDRTTRPITLSNANQYVNRPIEAAAVLNTPFSIIRSIGKTAYKITPYMSADEAKTIFNPVHMPADSAVFTPKNVVILIVESFSRGFIGALNKELNDSTYKGYTPFTDKLISNSLTYKNSYANGMKSIDGMPSVLSSIPMMIEPFFLTPAALNDMGGIAYYLKKKGYSSAFFHGAPNGSMGFEAFARRSGFDDYFGLTEYNDKYPGNDDFDGSWAVWDEPFLQFFAEEMTSLPQPFVASVFTASSHHPFAIPKEYVDTFPEEDNIPLLKCIRYTDHSLRQFFTTAAKQPWYENTLFVLTSDHSSSTTHDKFTTSQEQYASPIIFYAPGDSSLRGFDEQKLAQQIDIMPTVLSYLGYDEPYVAFGIDLLQTAPNDTWTFNYNGGLYQYADDNLFIQFDGNELKAAYDFRNDPMLENNIVTDMDSTVRNEIELKLKAFIQQYATAMNENRLLPEKW